ncbi:MAG TPA: VOC family protein [Polyangiaceae bacterium]|nr:VOC family protein [Polyangiaceae bacterium]
MTIIAIDHVQLAMPVGREQEARAFYSALLGLPEIPKPPELAGRGGAWFESSSVKVHLGVDMDFRPARKAHPGLLVDDLEGLANRLRAAGVTLVADEALPGQSRYFVDDPFGNRLELLQAPADLG